MRDDRSKWRLPSSRARREAGYERVLDRVFERVQRLDSRLRRERDAAPGLLSRLLSHPHPRRMLMARNSDRFCTIGLCEQLVEASWEARFERPTRTRNLAEAAVTIATRLDAETYGDYIVADLRGRSWSHYGNALRILADLRGAAKALNEAEHHLEQGSGEALEWGFYLRAQATLVRDFGRLEEAEALVDEAITLYRAAGHDHELGMTLLSKANLRGVSDDSEGEIRCLQQALQTIDLAREPRTRLIAVQALTVVLHQQGRNAEALASLVRNRFLYFEFGDRVTLLRLHWLEGVIARDMGRHEMAEGALREARRGFLEAAMPYEMASVSFDLAQLYLECGRNAGVRQLALEMVAFFRSRQIHRHALAAALLFQKAAQREEATIGLIHRISSFLERAQHKLEDPSKPSVDGETAATDV